MQLHPGSRRYSTLGQTGRAHRPAPPRKVRREHLVHLGQTVKRSGQALGEKCLVLAEPAIKALLLHSIGFTKGRQPANPRLGNACQV